MTKNEYEDKVLKEYKSGEITRIDKSSTKGHFILCYTGHERSEVKKEWIDKLLDVSVKDGNGFIYDGTIEDDEEIL